MRLLFYLLTFFTFTSCANTEHEVFASVHGIISNNQTGEAIPNATIQLSPGGIIKTNRNDGYFEFNELTPGQYTITVQKTGYYTYRKSFDAITGTNTEVNITLSQH
ncbi:MAG: carboxypeptidase-like regulatory domain-containing protein [Paraprevotella sp.]|nr:carboxypeptidase-like regulatory domain-containing protein [Paraprevotella sp.]